MKVRLKIKMRITSFLFDNLNLKRSNKIMEKYNFSVNDIYELKLKKLKL